MAEKQSAFVLPVEAASSMDVQNFPGFPGDFMPGEPTLVDLPPDEAEALVKELRLPLKKVAASKGKEPERIDPVEFANREALEPGESVPKVPAGTRLTSSTPEGSGFAEEEAELSQLPAEALEPPAEENKG